MAKKLALNFASWSCVAPLFSLALGKLTSATHLFATIEISSTVPFKAGVNILENALIIIRKNFIFGKGFPSLIVGGKNLRSPSAPVF